MNAHRVRAPLTSRSPGPRVARTACLGGLPRELLSQLYFGGARLSDEQVRGFGQTQWGRYQRDVGLYLATETDAWRKDLGVDVRVRSAALNDPDRP
jgi:hypothetical protein